MAGVGCKRSHYLLFTRPGQRNHHGTGSSNDLGYHWEQCPWTWGKDLGCPLKEGDIASLSTASHCLTWNERTLARTPLN